MINLGNKEALQDEYHNFLRVNPRSGAAVYFYYNLLANDYVACRETKKALQENPDDEWLKSSDLLCEAAKQIKAGQEDSAFKLLDSVTLLALRQDRLLLRAQAWDSLGKYDEVTKEAEAVIRQMPFDPDGYITLASAYYNTAQFKKALDAATIAADLGNRPSAHSWKAVALKTLGKMAESNAEYDKILKLLPVTADDYEAIGWAYYNKGQAKNAWEYLNEYKKRSLNPAADVDPLLLENQLFGFKQARVDCDEVFRVNPHNIAAHYISGLIYQSNECQCYRAIDDFDSILNVNPKHLPALLGKVSATIKEKRYGDALNAAKAALSLAPDDWEALYMAGYAFQVAGKYDESAHYLKRSLELNPDNTNGYLYLGETMLLLGRSRDAESNFELARKHPGSESDKVEAGIEAAKKSAGKILFWKNAEVMDVNLSNQNISKAPAEIRNLIRIAEQISLSTGPIVPMEEYYKAADVVKAKGKRDIRWLRDILLNDLPLSGRYEYAQSTLKDTSADILGSLDRWDDLLEALDSRVSGAADGAQRSLGNHLATRRKDLLDKYLPRIESIAMNSRYPASRIAAMQFLERTANPQTRRLTPICLTNLSFSAWVSKLWTEPNNPAVGQVREQLVRLKGACPQDSDLKVQFEAMNCLKIEEAPSAIVPLLGVARQSTIPYLRAEALSTLSKITKEYFGKPAHNEWRQMNPACETGVQEVWELLASSPSTGTATTKVSAIVGVIENSAVLELAKFDDQEIVDAWDGWWRRESERVPHHYDERILAVVNIPPMHGSITLFSSGRIVTTGGWLGKRRTEFEDLAQFNQYINQIGNTKLMDTAADTESLEWIKKKAIPALQKAESGEQVTPKK